MSKFILRLVAEDYYYHGPYFSRNENPSTYNIVSKRKYRWEVYCSWTKANVDFKSKKEALQYSAKILSKQYYKLVYP